MRDMRDQMNNVGLSLRIPPSRPLAESLESRCLLASPVVGDVWQRSVDWTIRPAGDAGTTNGNPDDDARGNPVWQYESVPLGRGMGQPTTGGAVPNPWYAGIASKLSWDTSWFGNAGGWTSGDDIAPIIWPNIAIQSLSNQPVPVIRWRNPAATEVTVAVSGTLTLLWNKSTGTDLTYPVDFVMMLQKPDGSAAPLAIANRKPAESSSIPIDLPALKVPAGGSIFYTFRYQDTTNRAGWVTLNDQNLTITLKALTGVPLTANDTAVTNTNLTVNAEVLANDKWDPRALPSVLILSGPAHGVAVVRADQSIEYTPANGYAGDDVLTYQVNDGSATNTATLTITVNQPYVLYVTPGGNDADAGTSWDSALATINGARLKIRALRAQSPSPVANKAVEVVIDDGVYSLSQAVQFDATDSGTAQYPVTYRARNPLAAAISGGKTLNLSWLPYASMPGAYVADLSGTGLTQTQLNNIHSLFVNGSSATRAREPDVGYYTIVSANPDTSQTYNKRNTFVFDDSNGDGAQDVLATWTNLTRVEVISYARWTESRMPIASVDAASHQVHTQGSLDGYTNSYLGDFGAIKDVNGNLTGATDRTGRYYIENVLEGLDTPGEWYLDSVAKKLYYYPRGGEAIGASTFVVPLLTRLIGLTGTSHVRFDGLIIRDTDWTMASTGQPGIQSAWNLTTPGAVYLDQTSNIALLNGRAINAGAYGIQMTLKTSTNSITVLDTEFYGNGAGAIEVNVHPDLDNGGASAMGNHRFSMNDIHDNNRVWRAANGLFLGRSGQNRIVANRIVDSTSAGIAVGWFDSNPLAVGHNQILRNTLINFDTVLYDGGAIYVLGNQPATVIMGNTVSGGLWTAAHIGRTATYYPNGSYTDRPTPPSGIYADETSSSERIMGNLIYDVNWGIMLHNTRDEIVTDNIIVDSALAAFYLAHVQGDADVGAPWMQANVFAWTLARTVRLFDGYLSTNPWSVTNRDVISYGPATIESPNSYGLPFLQSTGRDKQAAVTASALFVDTSIDDFRIRLSAQPLVKQQQGFAADWLLEPPAAPANVSFMVNDGSAQRSMVIGLTLTFNVPVSLTSGAITLALRGGTISFALSNSPASGFSNTHTLTFSGTGIIGGSLPDGAYVLAVNAAAVKDTYNQSLTGANRTYRFHRLFGDVNGDRMVNSADLSVIKLALNRPANYLWYLNYDGIGTVNNNSDYLQFRKRLLKPLL